MKVYLMKTKKCSRCGKDKLLDEFPKNKACFEGHSGVCKSCRYDDRKKWLKQGGNKVDAAIARKYRASRKGKENRLMREYGLSSAEWQEFFDEQKGKCLICDTHQSDLKQTLNVDHCHETGRVRGLLCGPCNQALGIMKDDKENVLRMVKYIDSHC